MIKIDGKEASVEELAKLYKQLDPTMRAKLYKDIIRTMFAINEDKALQAMIEYIDTLKSERKPSDPNTEH